MLLAFLLLLMMMMMVMIMMVMIILMILICINYVSNTEICCSNDFMFLSMAKKSICAIPC